MAENPFLQGVQVLNQGINSGAEWAYKAADLHLQKQQLEQQQQRIQDLHEAHTGDMTKLMLSNYQKGLFMDKGPVKTNWIEHNKALFGINSAMPTSESFWDSLNESKDSSFYPKATDAMTKAQAATVSPNFNKVAFQLAKSKAMMGENPNDTMDMLIKQGGEMSIQAQKTQAAMALKQYGTEQTNARYGVRDYNHQIGQITPLMDTSSRISNLIKAIRDPSVPDSEKIKSSKNLRAIINIDEAKVASGKANFGEGTMANLNTTSYAAQLKDLFSKIDEDPSDTISQANLSQTENVYKDLTKSMHESVDRIGSQVLAGALPGQKDVLTAKIKSTQQQYANKFGYWGGSGVDKGDGTLLLPTVKKLDDSSQSAGNGNAAQSQSTKPSRTFSPEQMDKAKQYADYFSKTDDKTKGLMRKQMLTGFTADERKSLGYDKLLAPQPTAPAVAAPLAPPTAQKPIAGPALPDIGPEDADDDGDAQ